MKLTIGLMTFTLMAIAAFLTNYAYANPGGTATNSPSSISTDGQTTATFTCDAGAPCEMIKVRVTRPDSSVTECAFSPIRSVGLASSTSVVYGTGAANPSDCAWTAGTSSSQSGTYHVVWIGCDSVDPFPCAGNEFDASRVFTTPEFGFSVAAIGAIAFAGLTLARRLKK